MEEKLRVSNEISYIAIFFPIILWHVNPLQSNDSVNNARC
jgi:hypothetical protein